MKSNLVFLFAFSVTQIFAQIPVVADGRIHVDQFGYLSAASKVAVIASPQIGYNAPSNLSPSTKYRVKRSYDQVTVFEANITPWGGGSTHGQSGDKAWWFDFSALTTNGYYFLYDSLNNLRSTSFTISDCAYSEALRHGFRTYYYQRCGAGKVLPFAEADWADAQPCHRGNLQDENCYSILNPIPASAKDLHGGWHDAGDYNKYVTFTYGRKRTQM